MTAGRSRLAAVAIVLALAVHVRAADVDAELSAIRDQLTALEIERAVKSLDALLARPGLAESARVSALDLRAQAHVASDDLNGAVADYKAILELRADYVPNRELTSKRAMDRFTKLKASMVGVVRLDLDPRDATLTLDGRPLTPRADGSFDALAGERTLRASRSGFDGTETSVRTVAGQETLLKVKLVPNARGLLVRTDVDGVAVTLDGAEAGLTARRAGETAELLLADVPMGEHEIRLAKPCFATESLHQMVSVDLADRSPLALATVSMRPARTRVVATGASYPGELRIDGERAASLPLESFSMCPGLRRIEVVASGRVVWAGEVAGEESETTLDFTPRPNVALIGTAWPDGWGAAASTWSTGPGSALRSGADLGRTDGWRSVKLPASTDLAVAVLAGAGPAGADRVVVYSPLLARTEDVPRAPAPGPPAWRKGSIGATLADRGASSVVVAEARPGGPAAAAGLAAGDRITSIGGRPVTRAAAARGIVEAAARGDALALDITNPAGETRRITVTVASEPRLDAPEGGPGPAFVAAWASSQAAAGGADAPLALGVLANLLEREGRAAAALDAWRKARAVGDGALAARAAYALGAAAQAEGNAKEAATLFERARAEAEASRDAALAAASRDRLADLGVTAR